MKFHHYEIQGSKMRPGDKYKTNITIHIVTTDITRAIKLAQDKHEELEIWSIEHRGNIDVIDDRRI